MSLANHSKNLLALCHVWTTTAYTRACKRAYLALKLDSLPAIVCLPGRVDEALQIDGEGAGGLEGEFCAVDGALDAPAGCQRAIGDVALVLYSQYVLPGPQNAFVYEQLECDASPWPGLASCICRHKM